MIGEYILKPTSGAQRRSGTRPTTGRLRPRDTFLSPEEQTRVKDGNSTQVEAIGLERLHPGPDHLRGIGKDRRNSRKQTR
jgi:hypothetical protein